MLAALIAFVVFSPQLVSLLFARDGYGDWFRIQSEPKACIINVWHVVEFKPYMGSIGGWLEKIADKYRKRVNGIHFNVISVSIEDAEVMLKRGLEPDVISFSYGFINDRQADEYLYELDDSFSSRNDISVTAGSFDGRLYALPLCASGYVLIYQPGADTEFSKEELIESAGSVEEFKKGKALSCICDMRVAGDIYRAGLTGGAVQFDAEPYSLNAAEDREVQFIGIWKGIEEYKLKYAAEFILRATNKPAQDDLCGLGLMPTILNAEAEFGQQWIKKVYLTFDIFSIKNCFSGNGGS